MAVNMDKPHRWKADVLQSVDFYNAWFVQFAPEAYRVQRAKQTVIVQDALEQTDFLRTVTPELLMEHPSVLPMLRMATSPPLARDRLIGLAYVTPNLVKSMEETKKHEPRIPPRMPEAQAIEELTRICQIIRRLADRDILTWMDSSEVPDAEEVHRGALILADRLCGAAADPIIRNAQEQRQLNAIREWLEARGYHHVTSASVPSVREMEPGTFTFIYNVPVTSGRKTINVTVDCAVKPLSAQVPGLPLFIEAKSAGDFTNTNKRRKEEAQKANQLRQTYGADARLALFLCGYFDTPYLGYEAAESIDWVWEHRIGDLALLLGDQPPPDDEGQRSNPDFPPGVGETQVAYEVSDAEQRRLAFQRLLDEEKTSEERNKLGQFATPPSLAREILAAARDLLPADQIIDFLDPAFGTGAFFSALQDVFSPEEIGRCSGFEIDAHYGAPAAKIWAETSLDLRHADFTRQEPPKTEAERLDLLICNPPYVRHHHLDPDEKKRLVALAEQRIGIRPSGMTGLYAHFLYLAHPWIRQGGLSGWLIPSEWLAVNYGRDLRRYLLGNVTLLHVHQFDPKDVQFDDALVSSTVVWFRNERPPAKHTVRFTYGGTLLHPRRERTVEARAIQRSRKWSTLFTETSPDQSEFVAIGDLFAIKRGLATGANKFFLLTPEEVEHHELPRKFLRPALPSPRYLAEPVIEGEAMGMPRIERPLLLLSCSIPEEEVRERYPNLWVYLQRGVKEGISERYLCRNRSPWYAQEDRDAARFLCSYMGRGSASQPLPLRFFLNRSQAVVTNGYLNLYPRPHLYRALTEDAEVEARIWSALNQITASTLIRNGRTYGGGLHKLEPKELSATPLPGIDRDFLSSLSRQVALF
ncbi:MAG: XamI family restriction endonuclease [Bacteroidota bacterium]